MRPFALITSASGGTVLVGPLDNHPRARTLPLSHPFPWKVEAQDQAPLLAPGWTGKVIFQEDGTVWEPIDLDSLTGLTPNTFHFHGTKPR